MSGGWTAGGLAVMPSPMLQGLLYVVQPAGPWQWQQACKEVLVAPSYCMLADSPGYCAPCTGPAGLHQRH